MARTLIRAETQVENANSGGTAWFLRTDGSTALEGNLDGANTYTIANLPTPSVAGDAASKEYVDSVAEGLDVKASVRVATNGSNIDLASATDPNPVDGVTLADGDRVLLKDQTTGSENGLYVAVTATDPTTWTRTTDADEDAEVTAGMFTFVEEGTANSDTGWVLTTNDPITVGTTDLSFSQFTGAGEITAGDGLVKTGSTLDVVAADASLTVTTNDIAVAIDGTAGTLQVGGTGLQVADATAGEFLIGQGAGTDTTFVALGGDIASVSAAGAVTLASDVLKEADWVSREVPSGTVDGTNDTFTLANTPVAGSEKVYLNGQLMNEGAGNDYTISGATITFAIAPFSGDVILVTYFK